jgi:hypothetical protein
MNDNIEQDKDKILDDLAINKNHYEYLIQPIKLARTNLLNVEDSIWLEDIENGFQIALKEILAEDIHKRLNVSIEHALVVLSDIDLKEFLC